MLGNSNPLADLLPAGERFIAKPMTRFNPPVVELPLPSSPFAAPAVSSPQHPKDNVIVTKQQISNDKRE